MFGEYVYDRINIPDYHSSTDSVIVAANHRVYTDFEVDLIKYTAKVGEDQRGSFQPHISAAPGTVTNSISLQFIISCPANSALRLSILMLYWEPRDDVWSLSIFSCSVQCSFTVHFFKNGYSMSKYSSSSSSSTHSSRAIQVSGDQWITLIIGQLDLFSEFGQGETRTISGVHNE